jgi:hypothetical protein
VSDDAKVGLAPCGHTGRHVVGNYVQCPLCDAETVSAVPVEIDDDRVTNRVCAFCGSNAVETFDQWGPRRLHCLDCGGVFT